MSKILPTTSIYCDSFLFLKYRFKYEVAVAEGVVELDEMKKFAYSTLVDSTSVELNLDDLAYALRSVTNFTVGIRVKTVQGYRSAFSELQTIEIQPIPTVICSTEESHHLSVGDCNQ